MRIIQLSHISEKGDRNNIIKENFLDNQLNITVEYPAVFVSAKILRDFIVDISDFFHFPENWKSRLTLIADELNNNAIEYGSLADDTNTMMISIQSLDTSWEICLEVTDSGRGNSAKNAQEMEELKKQRLEKGFEKHNSIRGRGLFMIITQLVDPLYFKDSPNGGLIVGVKKNLKK